MSLFWVSWVCWAICFMPQKPSDVTVGSLTYAISPQFTAFFTSATIFAYSAAVNSFGAKAVGHMFLGGVAAQGFT
jgi:hypothetical protein